MSPAKAVLAFIPILATTTAACTGPLVNIPALDPLKGFETMQANPNNDGFGNPAIGYGHLCTDAACSDVPFPKPLSEDSTTRMLQGNLADAVTNALGDPVTLNDNQYGALVSWTLTSVTATHSPLTWSGA